MEEGSFSIVASNGKASDSHSLVMENDIDKMPDYYGDRASERSMEASESDATSTMEKGSCSSWVVEIQKMLEDADASVEMLRWSRHSIYRVPQWIKEITNGEAYSPRFVSLGPLHHGEPHLLPMEEHKRRAVAHMVKRSGKPLQDFVAAIDEVVDELQAAYNDLDGKWLGANKGRFVELMVMDGCFLTEWAWGGGYATNDPIFSAAGYEKLFPAIYRDMIAMENQLPLIVLQRLIAVETGEFWEAVEMNNKARSLLLLPLSGEDEEKLGLHILHIFHKCYCGNTPPSEEFDKYESRTQCAVELAEAGIRFKTSDADSIHDVDFEKGVLRMPLLELHDQTEIFFLNMMAFERLRPGSNCYVSCYVSFLDKIIESERDVALLRSERVLENLMGSDKKVVEMFHTLTKLADTPQQGSKLGNVNWKVYSHCKKRRNKWRASFMNYPSSFFP